MNKDPRSKWRDKRSHSKAYFCWAMLFGGTFNFCVSHLIAGGKEKGRKNIATIPNSSIWDWSMINGSSNGPIVQQRKGTNFARTEERELANGQSDSESPVSQSTKPACILPDIFFTLLDIQVQKSKFVRSFMCVGAKYSQLLWHSTGLEVPCINGLKWSCRVKSSPSGQSGPDSQVIVDCIAQVLYHWPHFQQG